MGEKCKAKFQNYISCVSSEIRYNRILGGKKKIGISSQLLWSFVGTQESPHFLPSHQGGAELSTVATTCVGYIFFFKIKVLFQRGAQSPTVKNKPGPLWDSRTFPEGTKGSGS